MKRTAEHFSSYLFRLMPLSFAVVMASSPVLAQESDQPSTAGRRGTAVSILFGAEVGPLFSTTADVNTESSKTGYAFGGHAVLNLRTSKASLDGGAGWFNSRINGPDVNAKAGQSGTETVGTRAGYAEAAGRYRVSRKLELGLLARVTFGTDSTFSTSDEVVTTPNVFAGPQLIYDLTFSRSIASRVGVFLLTDLTIAGRQIFWLGTNFDIGVPLTRGDVVVKKETKIKYKERNRFIIDAEVVNFVTNSTELSEGAKRYLVTLGRFLANNPTVWERLVVSGHADQRGDDEHNEELAEARANAVREVLLSQGVQDDRIVLRFLGSRDPTDEEDADIALARNRRVELYFIGRVNVVALRAGLIKVKQVATTPETCVDDTCR